MSKQTPPPLLAKTPTVKIKRLGKRKVTLSNYEKWDILAENVYNFEKQMIAELKPFGWKKVRVVAIGTLVRHRIAVYGTYDKLRWSRVFYFGFEKDPYKTWHALFDGAQWESHGMP